MESGCPMCLVRVLPSEQVGVKAVGTVGFPKGGTLVFISVYKKIVGEFYWECSDAQEGPRVIPDHRIVSKLCSGQFSFSNPKLWGVVRSKEGNPLKIFTYRVDGLINLMNFII